MSVQISNLQQLRNNFMSQIEQSHSQVILRAWTQAKRLCIQKYAPPPLSVRSHYFIALVALQFRLANTNTWLGSGNKLPVYVQATQILGQFQAPQILPVYITKNTRLHYENMVCLNKYTLTVTWKPSRLNSPMCRNVSRIAEKKLKIVKSDTK